MDAGTTDETVIWLQLARCEGVGAVTCNRLLAAHGSPLAALEVVRRHPAADGTQRRVPDRLEILRELAALADLGGHLLVSGRAHYPDSLRSLPDAPPVLSVRGDPGLLRHPAVAIVGARNASAHGCLFARRLGQELAAEGLVVVSGLARGIDTAAHEGALAAGGATVAVIAGGVDVVYPPENAALMERIVVEGAVVAERPLGAIARRRERRGIQNSAN